MAERARREGPQLDGRAPTDVRASHNAPPVSYQASTSTSARVMFALLAVVCVLVGIGYVAWAARRDAPLANPSAGGAEGVRVVGGGPKPGSIVFQHVARDKNYARVAWTTAAQPDAVRQVSPLTCQRVHFAAGRGLCLVPINAALSPKFSVGIFDADFVTGRALTLEGVISRARVSPDGRFGAVTAFQLGHSYSDDNFSTQTTLIDMTGGRSIGDLETFEVVRNGRTIRSIDFNFWGVTFARDGDRFYATLATRGKTYLVEGSVAAKRMRVLRENVECPSLSPDDTRIAYKKRVSARAGWRLHVLDLRSGADQPLAETHSVDDQVEWLDERRVLYGYESDTWVVAADGSGDAVRYLSNALSPAVVRTSANP